MGATAQVLMILMFRNFDCPSCNSSFVYYCQVDVIYNVRSAHVIQEPTSLHIALYN